MLPVTSTLVYRLAYLVAAEDIGKPPKHMHTDHRFRARRAIISPVAWVVSSFSWPKLPPYEASNVHQYPHNSKPTYSKRKLNRKFANISQHYQTIQQQYLHNDTHFTPQGSYCCHISTCSYVPGWAWNRYSSTFSFFLSWGLKLWWDWLNCMWMSWRASYRFLGLFISEALHPFLVYQKAGFEIDFASEDGTYKPDHNSLSDDFLKEDDKKIYEDKNSDFRSKLDKLKSASAVNADEVSWFGSQ